MRLTITASLALLPAVLSAASWIRPLRSEDPLIWGRSDGVVFGIASSGGMRGPRGLIRVGIAKGPSGGPELINFIAVEPVVAGASSRLSRMGFSELEQGADGQGGKRLTVGGEIGGELIEVASGADPLVQFGGALRLPHPPRIEQLSVRLDVEPFKANGAHVYVIARMISTRPEEIQFSVHHRADSAPVEELTLTATMGNYERLRHLWLRDRTVDSREYCAGYEGNGFVDRDNFPLAEMLRYGDGDAIALATTDEADPSAVTVPNAPAWNYRAQKLTQYWRVPARHIQPDLRVKVNGRRVYWSSSNPIPGGPAFENFELRQRYVAGQVFAFGLTPQAPSQIQPKIPHLSAQEERGSTR